MIKIDIQNIVRNLIDTFLYAGKVSIKLRDEGLVKKIKSDNTPVSNGDLEVNKIILEINYFLIGVNKISLCPIVILALN